MRETCGTLYEIQIPHLQAVEHFALEVVYVVYHSTSSFLCCRLRQQIRSTRTSCGSSRCFVKGIPTPPFTSRNFCVVRVGLKSCHSSQCQTVHFGYQSSVSLPPFLPVDHSRRHWRIRDRPRHKRNILLTHISVYTHLCCSALLMGVKRQIIARENGVRCNTLLDASCFAERRGQ